jgi:hypothetical protein
MKNCDCDEYGAYWQGYHQASLHENFYLISRGVRLVAGGLHHNSVTEVEDEISDHLGHVGKSAFKVEVLYISKRTMKVLKRRPPEGRSFDYILYRAGHRDRAERLAELFATSPKDFPGREREIGLLLGYDPEIIWK